MSDAQKLGKLGINTVANINGYIINFMRAHFRRAHVSTRPVNSNLLWFCTLRVRFYGFSLIFYVEKLCCGFFLTAVRTLARAVAR